MDKQADVCLILEGTYPYVRGGVSTWVHQIISSLPELTFSVFYIGWEKQPGAEFQYDPLPGNLLEVREAYLFGDQKGSRALFCGKQNRRFDQTLEKLAVFLDSGEVAQTSQLMPLLQALADLAAETSFESVWKTRKCWDVVEKFYQSSQQQQSFVDFFWNLKNLVHPAWRALRCVGEVPKAKVYHSVCTGYAGFIGAVVSRRYDRPYLLSEHGIYVRERVKDLLKREWTPKGFGDYLLPADRGVSHQTRLWIDFFLFSGKTAYDCSQAIVSLFQRNKEIQVKFGAEQAKVAIIPNGIDLESFQPSLEWRRQRVAENQNEKVVVGFLGRVVEIKDVKMLIRAAAEVCRQCPQVEFWIVGPKEEDPEYARVCESMIEQLGMTNQVSMPGGVSHPLEALPHFDIMVLSSISEGLPFAVIEAFAMEMPVVSTRVGACEELIYGRPDEQPQLGKAGEVVPVGDSSALANALVPLVCDSQLRIDQGRAGRKRVETYYTQEDVVTAYREIYRELAMKIPVGRKGAASQPVLTS